MDSSKEYDSNPGREKMQKKRFLRDVGQMRSRKQQKQHKSQFTDLGNMLGSVLKQIYPNMVGEYWPMEKKAYVPNLQKMD